MRIGIDARKISDTGIGRYIENLALRLLETDENVSLILFMAQADIEKFNFPEGRVGKVLATAGKYSLSEHWAMGRLAGKGRVDLFHEPHFTLPLYLPCKSVVTIHDVIHLLDPQVGKAQKIYARWMIGSALKRADHVLTVSEHSKQNLVDIFSCDPEKITVTYNGAGNEFSPAGKEDMDKELSRFNLLPGYYIYVGSDRPHKNLKAVAAAMALTPEDARFVIVGRAGQEARAMFAPYGERVAFINHVGVKTLTALYTAATALYFPSYMEGFGLPPLEAMACRTPVVCSSSSVMPEVVGDAAALVHPDDAEEAARLLTLLKRDKAFRESLIQRGKERIKKFSWDKLAGETLEIYRKVLV